MATYTDASVGYGDNYTIDMRGEEFLEQNWWWGWQQKFYVLGYVLNIGRTDRVNGLTIDSDWEKSGDPEWYFTEVDAEGDPCVFSSVVHILDGAEVNDISIYRGMFLVNEPSENNVNDTRWTATVNGLDVNGEFAIVYAYGDSVMSDVTVRNGAFYSFSEGLKNIEVSNLGKLQLGEFSSTDELTVKGGFVQADSDSYIKKAVVTGGQLSLDVNANVDSVTVRDGGILVTEGAAAIRSGLIGKDGVITVTGNANDLLMDFQYEVGARVSIGSGVYSTVRAEGLRFNKGVVIGYGFDNGSLSYFVDGIFHSVSANESRDFVATHETVTMGAGRNAYNLTIENGGALVATGGRVEGLRVRMNYADLSGNSVATGVVLQAPELIDANARMFLSDTASASGVRVYDNSEIYADGKSKLSQVTLNDRSECYLASTGTTEMSVVTVNDASYVGVYGGSVVKNMTLNSGVVEIGGNGKVESLLMNGGAVNLLSTGSRITNAQQYGGTIAVMGDINGITVHDGGRLTQLGDDTISGKISNVTLKDGAWLAINNISTIQGSFDPSKITVGYDFNSGYQVNGKESYKYIVSFYEYYNIINGYTAKDMCISVGNESVVLCNGGTMVNGDVENGCLTVQGGAKMTGTINLYGETYYLDDSQGVNREAGINFLSDTAFIEDATFNFVLGNNMQMKDYAAGDDMSDLGLNFATAYGDGEKMFNITLTIDSALKKGETYSMYLGSGFKMEDVDVYGKNGEFLGTVTSSGTLSTAGKNISLVYLNETNQIYERQWAIYVESTDSDNIAGDIDGNGLADVLMNISKTNHPSYGAAGAWLIQENQTAKWGSLSNLKQGAEILGTGSVDPDKKSDDIFVIDNGTVGAWITDEKGKVTSWKSIRQVNSVTDVIGLGDFNADGKTDLLLKTASGDIGCSFTGVKDWNYFQSVGKEWNIAAVGDFNGDGRSDLVLEHDAGFAGCWLTNANGTASWSSLDNLKAGQEIVGAGDFNGDGIDDVLLQQGNYCGAWIVENGNAVGWMGLGNIGNGAVVEQIADFNSDGVDDLRLRVDKAIGVQLVNGKDDLSWNYFGSVGSEWNTALAAM